MFRVQCSFQGSELEIFGWGSDRRATYEIGSPSTMQDVLSHELAGQRHGQRLSYRGEPCHSSGAPLPLGLNSFADGWGVNSATSLWVSFASAPSMSPSLPSSSDPTPTTDGDGV